MACCLQICLFPELPFRANPRNSSASCTHAQAVMHQELAPGFGAAGTLDGVENVSAGIFGLVVSGF